MQWDRENAIYPSTKHPIFNDFVGRRAGILKALTTDAKEFYQKCDPDCPTDMELWGNKDGSWMVVKAPDGICVGPPRPHTGINFARGRMKRRDWLELAALQSEAWLLQLAFYFGARLSKEEREELFSKINELPSVSSVLLKEEDSKKGTPNFVLKEKNSKGGIAKFVSKNLAIGEVLQNHTNVSRKLKESVDVGPEQQNEGGYYCGTCKEKYIDGNTLFWIACDSCERWFHGVCVGIKNDEDCEQARMMKRYKCPGCQGRSK